MTSQTIEFECNNAQCSSKSNGLTLLTPEQIADNVKRLREVGSVAVFEGQTRYYQDSLTTINALVDLVTEMHAALEYHKNIVGILPASSSNVLTKSEPIAALKEKL